MTAADARPADGAVRGILFSNALTIALAWWFGDGLLLLLWPYWVQSVVIGFFAQRRIRMLRTFSVEGLRINGRPVTETPAARTSTANFFVVHYGLFHLVYAVFLLTFTASEHAQGILPSVDPATGDFQRAILGRLRPIDLLYVGLASGSFAWTHAASHREHVAADLRGRPNLGALMFMPYLRIIPMHLTIILGAVLGGGAAGLLLWGSLKAASDVAMHKVEHRLLQRGAAG